MLMLFPLLGGPTTLAAPSRLAGLRSLSFVQARPTPCHFVEARRSLGVGGRSHAEAADATREGGGQQPQTGAATMSSYCTPCHGVSLIAQQRLAQDGWTREVDKMMRWGARVPDDQKQALVGYLAETFRVARPMGNVNRYLPEGTGADLVRASCLGCHGDPVVGAQRRTRAEWSQIVDRMIEWGASIPRARTTEVVDYLMAHFGEAPSK